MFRSYSVEAVECPRKNAEAEARTLLLRQAHSDDEALAISAESRSDRFSTFGKEGKLYHTIGMGSRRTRPILRYHQVSQSKIYGAAM
jgi:hypothetical protein